MHLKLFSKLIHSIQNMMRKWCIFIFLSPKQDNECAQLKFRLLKILKPEKYKSQIAGVMPLAKWVHTE